MEFIRQLDCRITVLHEGAVLAEGEIEFVMQNQDVIDVCWGAEHAEHRQHNLHYGSSRFYMACL